jgi:hypothetical protein
MHSSQLTHISNKEVSIRLLHEEQHFATKEFHAKMQPQGWIQEKNA